MVIGTNQENCPFRIAWDALSSQDVGDSLFAHLDALFINFGSADAIQKRLALIDRFE
jgi:hypothetical protein